MGRNKTYNREQVIEAALEVFWRQGYRATSISDLTGATGVNRKSLYAEFGDKDGLFMAAMQSYCEQRKAMAPILLAEPMGLANIKAFFDQLAIGFDQKGCLFTLNINEIESVPKAALDVSKEMLQFVQQAFTDNLIAAGLTQNNATSKGIYLLSVMQGMATLSRGYADRRQLKQISDNALETIIQN